MCILRFDVVNFLVNLFCSWVSFDGVIYPVNLLPAIVNESGMNAMTKSNLARLLWSETSISWYSPIVPVVVGLDSVESVSSIANVTVCTSVQFHPSHFASRRNHNGTSLHNVDA